MTDSAPVQTAGHDALHPRKIRSFVTRAGRMTTAQQRALQELGPRWLLPFDPAVTDLAAWCAQHVQARGQPYERLVLEIGFGMGRATAHIASLMPDTLFIGCEVHAPGVGALLKLVDDLDLHNVRIIQHDATDVIERMIAPGTLDGVHLFFPDPWPKKRHHKRRIIQPPFAHELARRLAPGGYLHCATDWQPYAEHMLEVLDAEPLLHNTADGYAPRPDYRPMTKFERRGLRLGHGVWDLLFRRC